MKYQIFVIVLSIALGISIGFAATSYYLGRNVREFKDVVILKYETMLQNEQLRYDLLQERCRILPEKVY